MVDKRNTYKLEYEENGNKVWFTGNFKQIINHLLNKVA